MPGTNETFEVELKFPLGDVEAVLEMLRGLGAARHEAIAQRDVYFAHPARDFAETDEALRIRTVGAANELTYKGPIVDAVAKTRREIEVRCADGADGARDLAAILEALGFRPVRAVEKERVPFGLSWEGWPVELALDAVTGLGDFLEMELVVSDEQRDAARDTLVALAARLGLSESERRSYLCLLLEKDRDKVT
jgi:adenylate cyclase class 2